MHNNTPPIEILIAEDEDTDAFFVTQAFGQAKIENNVHWATDGQKIMDFLHRCGEYADAPRPHLIILDIKMPNKDGYEVLAEIKGDEALCDIPVIIMSASHSSEDIVKAYKHHANAYVPKANGLENMMEFVNAIEQFWFMKARLPQTERY